MYDIPTTVKVGEREYAIRNRGDFRVVLDCFKALDDEELTTQERLLACLIIFYEELDDLEDLGIFDDLEEAVKQMYRFFNANGAESPGYQVNRRLIDWEQDSLLICSAVNKVAGKEIRAEQYLHWWTFLGYYMAIGESPLSNIVGIRNKILTGKKLEKYEREFKRENPQYFVWNSKTVEDKEADELVRALWNNGEV